jgi:hypothetical protein
MRLVAVKYRTSELVEAFSSCSAWSVRLASNAFVVTGVGRCRALALCRGRPRGEPASSSPSADRAGVGCPFYVAVTASVTLTVTNLSRLVREPGCVNGLEAADEH